MNLRLLRQDKCMTLQEVADELNFSVSLLSKIERGKTALNPIYARKLSDFYNVKIEPFSIVVEVKEGEFESVKQRKEKYVLENEKLKEVIQNYKMEIEGLKMILKRLKKNQIKSLELINERVPNLLLDEEE